MNKGSYHYKRLMILIELTSIRKSLISINKISAECSETDLNDYIVKSKLGAMLKYIDKVHIDIHSLINSNLIAIENEEL